jgi:hypothetical protein
MISKSLELRAFDREIARLEAAIWDKERWDPQEARELRQELEFVRGKKRALNAELDARFRELGS